MSDWARMKPGITFETLAQDAQMFYDDLQQDLPQLTRTAALRIGHVLYFVAHSIAASLVFYSFLIFTILSLVLSYLHIQFWVPTNPSACRRTTPLGKIAKVRSRCCHRTFTGEENVNSDLFV